MRSIQGRFILLDHPQKVNLTPLDFEILPIAEPTKECGFQPFFGASLFSPLWRAMGEGESALLFHNSSDSGRHSTFAWGKLKNPWGKVSETLWTS